MQSTPKAKFDQMTVDTAKENLAAMPPAPRETKVLTIGQAIRELTPTIAKLMKRGYSRARVLELLKEQGIDCTPATFRTIYRAPKPRERDAKRRAATPATTGPTVAAPGERTVSAAPSSTPAAASKPALGANGGGARGESRSMGGAAPMATAKAS